MQITQLPNDGADYTCTWGDWCARTPERCMDQESVTQYNEMMKRLIKFYPNTALPTVVMRAMCDTHLLVFEREFDRVEQMLADKDAVQQVSPHIHN